MNTAQTAEQEQIIAKLRSLSELLRAEGVTGLSIFGSRARGDQRSDSDLDILIDVDPQSRFSLLNLSGVGLIVKDATGLEAQICMRRSLDGRTANRISEDLISIF